MNSQFPCSSGLPKQEEVAIAKETKWILADIEPETVKNHAQDFGLSTCIIEILHRRGLTSYEQVSDFISPQTRHLNDPFLLDQMTEVVDRIGQAVANNELIWVFGDTDVDGFSSTAVLIKALKCIGARVQYYIPNRFQDGYGLLRHHLEAAKELGTKLVITVDTGIRAWDSARYARELGLDLIITDHHLIPTELPDANFIINPKKDNCAYPEKWLAGVGVSFKLASALLARFEHAPCDLNQLLGLTALGTISDRVPLQGENRAIAYLGLDAIRSNNNMAWSVLCQKNGIEQKKLTALDVSEKLVPLITSGKVMSGVHFGVDLFMTDNQEEAEWMVEQLHLDLNRWRQERDAVWERLLARLPEFVNDTLVIVHDPTISRKFLGVSTSRLSAVLHKPVVIIGEKRCAECRAPLGELNLLDLLDFCSDHLLIYGGHKPAAGCTVLDDQEDAFIAKMREFEAHHIDPDAFEPTLTLDAELLRADLIPRFHHQLQMLEPFGQQNPLPTFLLRDLNHFFNNIKIEQKALVGDDCILYFDSDETKHRVIDGLNAHHEIDVAVRYNPRAKSNIFRFDLIDVKVRSIS